MRTFRAYVDESGKNVGCSPEKMHVQGHHYEELAVCLDDRWVRKYKLFVDVTKDLHASVEKQRLNTSAVVLKDNNEKPGEIKFTIKLRPLPRSKAPAVKSLDPIIVNED